MAAYNDTSIRSVEYIKKFNEIHENFNIIEKIGEGSFASVFLVKPHDHQQNKDKYALKFTIPTIEINRIENELRILHKLGGINNIVKLYLGFRVNDHVFMLMQYVQDYKFEIYYLQMDLDEIKDYMRNLLKAIKYVHENNIIHRDIKPANFLYDRNRKKYALIDFGLAQSEEHGDVGSWFDDISVPKLDYDTKLNDENNKCYPRSRSMDPRKLSRQPLSKNSNSNITVNRSDSFDMRHNLSSQLRRHSSNANSNQMLTVACICGNRPGLCDGCRNKIRAGQGAHRGGTPTYRAPEVLLGHIAQSGSIDIWAAGIIMLSFVTGRYPVFRYTGNDADLLFDMVRMLSLEYMQLGARAIARKIIVDPKPEPLIGKPWEWLKNRCQYMRLVALDSESYTKKEAAAAVRYGREPMKPLLNATYKFDNSMYELISLMLNPNPSKRISAGDALNHYYFED